MVSARSIFSASSASANLRDHVCLRLRKKLRATCCVIVEAPSRLWRNTLANNARAMPFTLTPEWLRKSASSVAISASLSTGGNSPTGMKRRRSGPNCASSLPSRVTISSGWRGW